MNSEAFGNSLIEIWCERMLAASWQGGLLLAFAWLVSRYLRQIPAATRCWIWRFAFFKFAVVLFLGFLLPIPLLPGPNKTEASIGDSTQEPTMVTSGTGQFAALAGEHDANALLNLSTSLPTQSQPIYSPPIYSPPTYSPPTYSPPTYSPPTYSPPTEIEASRTLGYWMIPTLFVAWIVGCVSFSLPILIQQWRAHRLVRNSRPFDHSSFNNRYRDLCARMKLRRPPKLAITSEMHSPVLVNGRKLTILIPEKILKACGPDELSLIVAHELAHAKRHDLWWNWLPVAVRTVFFFHPLVWLTQSRYALDQEMACDCLTLERTRAKFKQYGNVLVKISTKNKPQETPTLAAIGVASSFVTLKSRILEMDRFNRNSLSAAKRVSGVVLIMGSFLIAPFHLVAQRGDTETTSGEQEVTVGKANQNQQQRRNQNQRQQQQQTRSQTNSVTASTTNSSSSGTNNTKNISITVNDDGATQSIQIKSRQDSKFDVTFTTDSDGQKQVNKYVLSDIEELAKKNKSAFEFYKKHATSRQGVTVGGRQSVGGGSNSTMSGYRPGEYSRNRGGTSANSQSSTAWQRSSSIGRNGRTVNRQSSGTTGNGKVGEEARQQMIQQIGQMIQQTDDAKMKEQLQELLQQMQGKRRQ